MTLDETLCLNKIAAESQLVSEMLNLNQSKDYVITHGCEGYRICGCYDCNGYNKNCKTYISNLLLNSSPNSLTTQEKLGLE